MTPKFGRMVVYIKKKKLMRTLSFGRMVVHKEKLYERGPYVLVEWLCANKRIKSMRTPIFRRMVVQKRKNK